MSLKTQVLQVVSDKQHLGLESSSKNQLVDGQHDGQREGEVRSDGQQVAAFVKSLLHHLVLESNGSRLYLLQNHFPSEQVPFQLIFQIARHRSKVPLPLLDNDKFSMITQENEKSSIQWDSNPVPLNPQSGALYRSYQQIF